MLVELSMAYCTNFFETSSVYKYLILKSFLECWIGGKPILSSEIAEDGVIFYLLFFVGFRRKYPNVMSVTVDGRYKCEQCGVATYKHKQNLYTHLRQNCGVPPQFQCHLCNYQGKRKSHLQTHVLLIHKELL